MKEFVRNIQYKGHKEMHLQLVPEKGEEAGDLARRAACLIGKSGNIVRATIFGNLDARTRTLSCLEKEIKEIDFPCTWIEGVNCSGSLINGAYFFSVEGVELSRIISGDSLAGSYYSTDEAGFLFLGNLSSPRELSPPEQTAGLLNTIKQILREKEMDLKNIIRTWFYLDSILDWYNEFNDVRTSFYKNNGVSEEIIPASTGIGGKNFLGSKVCLELNAIKPKNNGFSIENVNSPLQCSALQYGSSFSRAKMFRTNSRMNMTISGTASIGEDGRTMHVNDIDEQIRMTFRVIREILDSQGFDFEDITRAFAYFKDKNLVNGFDEFVRKETGADVEFICSQNSICRRDLLFEADIDLAKTPPQH
jgi:enamine deaminase RidA (YjgF/YER057c/UK114 family)